MSPLLGCVLSAVVFVGSIVGGPQRGPLRLDQWHHEYIGAAACGLGAVTHSRWILTVGAVVSADDATQHLYQRANHDLGIRSPLNIGYQVTLGKVPLFSSLNRLLDNLLH